MSLRWRNRKRREGAKAAIDMNSLIDLTFLLLVVFIVTLPTLEQNVKIVLPVSKVKSPDDEKTKNLTVSVDKQGRVFLGEEPMTHEILKERLKAAVQENSEVNMIIRGDVMAYYGDVYTVIEIAKDAGVTHLGLASVGR